MLLGSFHEFCEALRIHLGKNIPGQQILACVAGVWLVGAGLAILWRRSARIGAAASAIVDLIFVAFWLPRYYAGIHALGWRIDVLLGISFGVAQQLLLVAPAAIVYASTTSSDSPLQDRAAIAARWMLGLPPMSSAWPISSAFTSSRAASRSGCRSEIFGRCEPESLSSWQEVQFAPELWMSWPPGLLR
jgi:hypothetical protein